MKAREVKRAKLVAKYAAKRAALKKIIATGEPMANALSYKAERQIPFSGLSFCLGVLSAQGMI